MDLLLGTNLFKSMSDVVTNCTLIHQIVLSFDHAITACHLALTIDCQNSFADVRVSQTRALATLLDWRQHTHIFSSGTLIIERSLSLKLNIIVSPHFMSNVNVDINRLIVKRVLRALSAHFWKVSTC